MNLFNYKILAAGFLSGLIIMGAGAGVGFMELRSMTFCGTKEVKPKNLENEMEKTVEANISGMDKVFYYSDNITIAADESLDGNTVRASAKSYCGGIQLSFMQQNNLLNTSDGHISIGKYMDMETFCYNTSGLEFETFKEFISDIKQRKIYDYTSPKEEITVSVAPENVDKFQRLPDYYRHIELPFTPEEGADIYYDEGAGEYYTPEDNGRRVLYPVYEEETASDETNKTRVIDMSEVQPDTEGAEPDISGAVERYSYSYSEPVQPVPDVPQEVIVPEA